MDGITRSQGGSAPPNHLERAMSDKRPIPEIDFTMHMMEDGTQVSTQERVCKGMMFATTVSSKLYNTDLVAKMFKRQLSTLRLKTNSSLPMTAQSQICSSSSNTSTARAV